MTTEKKEYPQEVIDALDSSISDKWFNIVFKGAAESDQPCALCIVTGSSCEGCPIRDEIGAAGCSLGLYTSWRNKQLNGKVHDRPSAEAAYAFYKWLVDLRAKVKVEEKKFKPFTVTINTLEEAQEMWHRTNPHSMRDPYDPDEYVKYSHIGYFPSRVPYPEHSVRRIWQQLNKALGRN